MKTYKIFKKIIKIFSTYQANSNGIYGAILYFEFRQN